eukprot:jgi/Mesen1/2561/ME000162S01684
MVSPALRVRKGKSKLLRIPICSPHVILALAADEFPAIEAFLAVPSAPPPHSPLPSLVDDDCLPSSAKRRLLWSQKACIASLGLPRRDLWGKVVDQRGAEDAEVEIEEDMKVKGEDGEEEVMKGVKESEVLTDTQGLEKTETEILLQLRANGSAANAAAAAAASVILSRRCTNASATLTASVSGKLPMAEKEEKEKDTKEWQKQQCGEREATLGPHKKIRMKVAARNAAAAAAAAAVAGAGGGAGGAGGAPAGPEEKCRGEDAGLGGCQPRLQDGPKMQQMQPPNERSVKLGEAGRALQKLASLQLPERVCTDFRVPPRVRGEWEKLPKLPRLPPFFVNLRRSEYLIKLSKKRAEEADMQCRCKAESASDGSTACPCSRDCICAYAFAPLDFVLTLSMSIRSDKIITEKCGWGVETGEAIAGGDFIVEYLGEVIDDATCEQRLWDMKERGQTNFFLVELSRDWVIDASYKGNIARFVNHSCQPNCELQKWEMDGEMRIGIFAKHDIARGTQLTYDYQFIPFGVERKACHCGAPRCRGQLGARPSKAKSVSARIAEALTPALTPPRTTTAAAAAPMAAAAAIPLKPPPKTKAR